MARNIDKLNSERDTVRSTHNVVIQIFPRFRRQVSAMWLQPIALAALESQAGLGSTIPDNRTWDVEVVVADDKTVQELNQRYRGLDEVTDVLAFSPFHSGQYEGTDAVQSTFEPVVFPVTTAEQESLGVVLVAWHQAERQAKQAGHPVQHELAVLIVHGILHLLGHDHVNPEETKLMRNQERIALDQVARNQKIGANQ
jgi:probable rRNA maturation factor